MTHRISVSCLLASLLFAAPSGVFAQRGSEGAKKADKASAYYHYALGHLYSELAGAYGNKGNFVDKAIDNYRKAMDADPDAGFLSEELSDLYIQAGRLREAVENAEEALRENPNDVTARRMLARIYTRLIGDTQRNSVNEEMVRKALEQYEKISEIEPDNEDVWLMLGRLYKLDHNSVESETAYKKVLELNAKNEDALIGLATVYSNLGDQSRAAEMLRRVVGMNPSVRTLTFLASTYEKLSEYELAAETYRKAAELAPRNNEIKRAHAQNLLMIEKEDEALGLFEELVAEDPRDAEAQLRLAQIYRQKGRLAKAREVLDAAKEASPGNLEVLYTDVNLLEAEGKTAVAIDALREILTSTQRVSYSNGEKTNRIMFLERLGLMYRGVDRFDEAVAIFAEIEDLDPEKAPRMAAQICDTWRQAKEFEKALEVIEAAYEKTPNDQMVGILLATVLADMGRSEEAVETIQALTGEADDRESYLTQAQIYEKTKDHDKMEAALEEAEKLSETDSQKATVLFMRGAMFERQKRFDEAEAAFREVLRLDPDNASAMNYLGYMFADQNIKLDESYLMITKALEYDPNNGAFLDSLGWVYYRMERYEEAAENLTRAARLVSRDPVVHDHLGDALFQLGELRQAIAHWKISVKEWESSSTTEKDLIEVSKIQKKLEGAEIRLARESSPAKPDEKP